MLTLLAAALMATTAPQDGSSQNGTPLDCDNAMTTLDMNDCAAKDVEAEEARLRIYLAGAIQEMRDNAESPERAAEGVREVNAAQKTWADYVQADCGAVYTYWQAGTIRNLMALECKRKLTWERTHHLWESYFVSLGDAEPALPEPQPLADQNPDGSGS